MPKKEAAARLKINKMLDEAGWFMFDEENHKANVSVESHVIIEELGDDFQNTKNGYIDYLLHGKDGHPIAVLEAKRESTHPLSAKEQAREYANSVNARYIILSNGNTHYLWNTKEGNPEPIMKFPAQASLDEFQTYQPNPHALAEEEVNDHYIAQSQMPGFDKNPQYNGSESEKLEYLEVNKIKLMRKYQVEAIHHIQASAAKGNKRYLLEMATGTGKTLTCAAINKLFLRTGNAKRILFLVDRIELEDQAYKAFKEYLGNDYTTVIYKQNKDDWQKAQIVVSTVQSLMVNNRYRDDFSPTDFELVVSDEAHRSISGNARAVFEYFVGYRIGLTATPKDYLKGFNQSEPNSQKEFERRQLLSTYETFGCKSGQPTYSYSLINGVKDGFLINPVVVDSRTEITTQLLSDKGLAVYKKTDENVEVKGVFSHKDYEKKIFNEATNELFCQQFIKHADLDPISGEVGKSLIFAVSQAHAAKIVNMLNKIAHRLWPGKYNSDFAVQVTSNVQNSQQFTINFTNNNLLGHTNWLENYESSKARVCVTVGMMTTGYDCPDLLNVCFMRPVFSPSDFVQMKGRGTRKHTFKYIDYNNEEQAHEYPKTQFKLIDFFAVCEYFNEKYDYSEPIKLPKIVKGTNYSPPGPGTGSGGVEEPTPTYKGPVDLHENDAVGTVTTSRIGKEGMPVDREMFKEFVSEQQNDVELVRRYQTNRQAAIQYLKENVFDKPNHFMNIDKISKHFKIGRRLEPEEALEVIMGDIDKPKTKQQILDEKFAEIISIYDLDEQLANNRDLYNSARSLFDAYISSSTVQEAIDQGDLTQLYLTPQLTVDEYKTAHDAKIDQPILEYIRDYINVDKLRI
jgi:type I restriction enzyme R subunit